MPRMPRLSQVFMPKDREFFDLFEEAATNVVRGADLLDQMLRSYPEHADLARDILICEQEGDRITHDIIHRLNNTFVTPIDREDIIAPGVGARRHRRLHRGGRRLPRPLQDRGADGAGAAPGAHPAPRHAPDRRGDAAAARLRGHRPLHGRDPPPGERRRPDRPRGRRVAVRGRHRPDGRDPLEGPLRAPRGGDRRLRDGRQRPRRASSSRTPRPSWHSDVILVIVVAHGAGVRLHQRLPRHRQRRGDVDLDARGAAARSRSPSPRS